LRANRSQSQAALMRAEDLSDQTSFRSICMSDTTGMAKRYETRVEQELARVRSNGGNAAREAIYTYLLGKDMREGKFKKKAAAPKKDAETPGVNRGRLPGARSDVHGRTGLSEREKRAKRLENVQI
jgi:hypothetical protein